MPIKDWKNEIFTIPNMLSLFRLLLIPVYAIIYLNAVNTADYYLAAGILAVSCLTDLIDGKIARHFNMISTLGKVLDPLADKATQFTLILCLAVKHPSLTQPVLWCMVVLFTLKEGFQLIAGIVNLKKGRVLKGALITGKLCTTVLFVSLIIMVMFPTLGKNAIQIISAIDIVFMLISFADYLFTYFKKDNRFQSLNVPNNKE